MEEAPGAWPSEWTVTYFAAASWMLHTVQASAQRLNLL